MAATTVASVDCRVADTEGTFHYCSRTGRVRRGALLAQRVLEGMRVSPWSYMGQERSGLQGLERLTPPYAFPFIVQHCRVQQY